MVNIDLKALDETKKACHQELHLIQEKYNARYSQLIWRYMVKEYCKLFIFAFMSFGAVLIMSIMFQQMTFVCIPLYFVIFGLLALLENMKDDLYHTKELMVTSYMNEGRSFLYRTIVIIVFQMIMIGMTFLVLPLNSKEFIYLLLLTVFPLFIAEMIALSCIQLIRNLGGIAVIYMVVYGIVIVCIHYFHLEVIISMKECLWVVGGSFILYIVSMILLYKQRKESTVLWN
ncbi:hypothetical protein [Candidatus Stoquefichus massiliensis]|uniref:hypothetical protein n=1 Tax=Candidatus Stoquefichus massiliensis TaxID=1470350 RepID=UPI00048330E2|nr:hypothetical protein [Candidatus Stoquefichus massiliensis]